MFQRRLRLSPAIGRSLLARFSTLRRRTRYSAAKGLEAQGLVSGFELRYNNPRFVRATAISQH